MVSRESLQSGMTVRSVHGERLGHILALGDAQFCIEKGLFFKKGFFASYGEIKEVRDGEVILLLGRDRLLSHDRGMGESVVQEVRTTRVPRIDHEIEATPLLALPLSGEPDGEAQVRSRDDDACTPTPVRPLKEGGTFPPAPGPDGL